MKLSRIVLASALICASFWWLSLPDAAPPAAALAPAPAPPPPSLTYPAPASRPDAPFANLASALASPHARPGEVILTFQSDVAHQRFLATFGSRLQPADSLTRLRTVRLTFAQLDQLRRDLAPFSDDLLHAGANILFAPPTLPPFEEREALPLYAFRSSVLDFLGVDPSSLATWGRGIQIAIIDSGVASLASAFDQRVHTFDLGYGVTPLDGHGTAVAALAAGADPLAPGLAPAATLLGLRVTDDAGLADTYGVAHAILAATDAGARIINISMGAHATSPLLEQAIAYADQRGALIVASSGNDQAASLAWPAAHPLVISVGAVDAAGQQVLFSNSGDSLNLTAPGYGIRTLGLDGSSVLFSGTSASAPLVSGALAAVLSQNPQLSPSQALAILQTHASDAGPPGPDPDYGHGTLNLGWAMNRHNAARHDPALVGQSFDPASSRVFVTVQNRSAAALSGLTLEVAIGPFLSRHLLPALASGAVTTVAIPVDPAALHASDHLVVHSQLVLPPGLTDAVPANNTLRTLLVAP